MYLNIKPYQIERVIDRPLSCFDDILYTLAKWKNKDCNFMFIDRWNFYKEDRDSDILGELFISKYEINVNYLRKFHGIDIKEKKVETYLELLNVLSRELLKGNPIIVIFDAYACPWDQFYWKYHNRHRCIVVGIDFGKKTITMCDPYNNREKEEIFFEDFEKGYMNNYYTVKYLDSSSKYVADTDKLIMM